jgi:hypothetical protein
MTPPTNESQDFLTRKEISSYVSLLSFDISLELRCEFEAEKKLILFDTLLVYFSTSETVYFMQQHEHTEIYACVP